MHGIIRLSLAVLVLAAVASLGCDPKERDFFLSIFDDALELGDIGGRVTVDGQGRSGVSVGLRRGTMSLGTEITGSGGNYLFENLDSGSGYTATVEFPPGTTCDPPEATVTVVAGQTTTVNFACTTTPTTGTLEVTVVGPGGTPISGAEVTASGPGSPRTGTTDANGLVRFTDVEPGQYTVSANASGQTCESRTADVTAGQTTGVTVTCQPTTGTLEVTVIRTTDDAPIEGAEVTVSGPGDPRTGTTDADGTVRFDNVTPGQYTVSASVSDHSCESRTADVTAGETTEITVPCTPVTTTQVPTTMQIEGSWTYMRSRTSTSGSCPSSTLPSTGMGSMSAQSSDALDIDGLDPDQTSPISGSYDPSTGAFMGSGSVTLTNGFQILTTVEATFGFDNDGRVVYDDLMVREHRDSGGTLVCTENYDTSGVGPVASSLRFKRGVRSLLPPGVTLLGLRPVTFRYRAPHGDPAVARVGLIAEEVARIFPRAVGLDGEGRPRSIHYGLLAGLAVEAVGTRIGSALETGAARLAGALREAIPNP